MSQTSINPISRHPLDHRIPPPVVVLLTAAVMWGVARFVPAVDLGLTTRLAAAGVFTAAGLAIFVSAVVAFRRAKTTINPNRPATASTLVTHGAFGLTRNPMYVGFTSLLTAWACWLSVPWVLLGPVVFVLYTTRFQIIPEERAVAAKFGNEYADYRARVRRWL